MIPRLATGMVLGKFLPPHAGHLYLIGCARRHVERLAVVVEHIADEPIPSATRVAWLRALVPEVDVVHLERAMPQDPSERVDFWPLWRDALKGLLPYAPEVVFASEAYGTRLARELDARFLPVDPARRVMPVSGTAVRASPHTHARFLPDPVRVHHGLPPAPERSARPPLRVAVVGPESTGKSTLARELAEHFDTHVVPEHAHTMIAAGVADPHALTTRDFEDFARGQRASEDELAVSANAWLFCDSDALTTRLYAETLLGSCPAWIEEEARTRRYALTLLTAPDVPWQDDVHRVDREGREAFFVRAERALRAAERPFVVLSGDWACRRATALDALAEVSRTTSPGTTSPRTT